MANFTPKELIGPGNWVHVETENSSYWVALDGSVWKDTQTLDERTGFNLLPGYGGSEKSPPFTYVGKFERISVDESTGRERLVVVRGHGSAREFTETSPIRSATPGQVPLYNTGPDEERKISLGGPWVIVAYPEVGISITREGAAYGLGQDMDQSFGLKGDIYLATASGNIYQITADGTVRSGRDGTAYCVPPGNIAQAKAKVGERFVIDVGKGELDTSPVTEIVAFCEDADFETIGAVTKGRTTDLAKAFAVKFQAATELGAPLSR